MSIFIFLLPAGLREAQPCRYCFYSMIQKGPLPRAKLHVFTIFRDFWGCKPTF